MKRHVTIEDLAAVIQRGFKEMANRGDVDRGVEAADKRFDALEDRLDRIEKLMITNTGSNVSRSRSGISAICWAVK